MEELEHFGVSVSASAVSEIGHETTAVLIIDLIQVYQNPQIPWALNYNDFVLRYVCKKLAYKHRAKRWHIKVK